MHKYRTHNCNELNIKNKNQKIVLSGWVNKKRDHGNLLFIDLRDNYGLTQCVIDKSNKFFNELEKIQLESVIKVEAVVVKRTKDTINSKLKTGEIEVKIESFEIIGHCKELPMPVFTDQEYAEEIRLKYRFLDLRREEMHENIILRSKVISFIRKKMIDNGFLEFQTPILTASSPEGARDFLVPSRVHPGKFYALPQAPQQFKQMVIISGFDKYFQIAPCFRDEDGRADRSPGEHYQLDMEMAFVEQEDVFKTVEPIFFELFTEFGKGKKVSKIPFKRITYKDSMLKYGTDKPDLRNPIEIFDVTEVIKRDDVKTHINVIGKYFINSPAKPGQNIKGKKAAKVVAVEDIIGSAIFFDAFAYASFIESPSFNFLSAYSTTTMAPSTSNPIDKISANNTTILIVKPITERAKIPDKKDPGIDIPTKRPDRTPRAPRMIIKTSIMAAITLFCKLLNIVFMYFELS